MTTTQTKEAAPDLLEGVAQPRGKKNSITKIEPPPNMLAIIASAAASPNVDVGKMRELLSMQREIMSEDARIAFTQDFMAMSGEMPSINRDGKIVIEAKAGKRGQSTPYATFENMHKMVTPILRKHGFIFWSEPDLGNDNAPIIMRGHLDHVKGHGKTCAIPLPFETSGSKNNVQGVGSSLSYGRRYCLMNLCNIVSHAPQDADDDGAGATVKIDAEQIEKIKALIAESGADIERFCSYAKVEKIEDIPASKFDACVGMLEKKKGAKS